MGATYNIKCRVCYNGGQKCWDLSSDITKTSDPSPPTPNKVEFGAKWVKLSAFFGHNIARGSGGDDGMNPKPNKKMSLGAESYGIIVCKGFFTQSQVLLSSIVRNRFTAIKWIFRHLSLQKYRKTFSLELLKCSFFFKQNAFYALQLIRLSR